MSIGTLRMPRLGETMEQGRIVAWLVEPGQRFERGEVLVEVETDKAVVEYPALGPGTLSETLVDMGQMVSIGTPIATVDTGAGPDWTTSEEAGADAPPDTALRAEDGTASAIPASEDQPAGTPDGAIANRPRATPLARYHARRNGVDLTSLKGTGRRGRIERVDVERALAMASPERGKILRRHGIAYQEHGSVGDVPVLLLHGFAADYTIWSGLIPGLVSNGAHVFVPDLPGHGMTEIEATKSADLAEGLAPFARSVFSGNAPHLIAHSLGALPAIALADLLPVSSVTLIAPAGLGPQIDKEFVTGLAHAQSVEEVSQLLGRMTEAPLPLSGPAMSQILSSLRQGRLTKLAAALTSLSGQAPEIRSALSALARRLPVRIIVGHRDRIINWSDAVSVSPNIALHHLPDCGHMPQWDALAELQAILKTVLEGIPRL